MAKLDFSKFHPVSDHWPFTPYCNQFYGGGWNHLSVAWQFHRRDQVLKWPRRLLFCWRGKHRWAVWYGHFDENGSGTTIHPVCKDCRATRLPSEKEIEDRHKFPRFRAEN